ncbi:MAG: pyruvate formate-lyase-activating protein [Ruminococcus sp.]|nr:pyruvate formate-lyase-activating protein [Ruminococcus sp.]
MTKGYIHSLETFGLVDGPGVRFVAFLQGCAMRCKFCHNPETWHGGGEEWDAEALWKRMYRYKSYWGADGGITISGGEPLLQMDFVTEVFTFAKKNNVSTTLDTSGQPFCEDENWLSRFQKLMDVTDLVMLDLKQMDESGHRDLTGHENANILRMAKWLSDNGKSMWIRHVLIPGVTDDENDLCEMRKFIETLKTVERVEVLPYHTLGTFKWEKLGMDYPLNGVPTPSDEEVERAEKLLGIR